MLGGRPHRRRRRLRPDKLQVDSALEPLQRQEEVAACREKVRAEVAGRGGQSRGEYTQTSLFLIPKLTPSLQRRS